MTLYIVVRNDIPAGLMMAQACHAARAYTCAWPSDEDENLVALTSTPAELEVLRLDARAHGYRSASFYEPDLDGELTAVALGGEAKKRLSQLPLALRDTRGIPASE
jgi:hypothetical protein